MRTRWIHIAIRISLLLSLFLPTVGLSQAEETPVAPPLDVMIVVDNSCSMFPSHRILAGCLTWGSDIDFLRITGADMLLARMGLGADNEGEYRSGYISFGEKADLIAPLTALPEAREALAEKIANPAPQTGTALVPALELGLTQLERGRTSKPDNRPVLVLVTDSVPTPAEGQSDEDIQRLLQAHPDISIFIMLLENKFERGQAWNSYVEFWQRMQILQRGVFVYTISDPGELLTTYNRILSQVQGTLAVSNLEATPDAESQVYISEYVRGILITAIPESNTPLDNLVVKDPAGNPVAVDQEGVLRFKSSANPVEVLLVQSPRLSSSTTRNYWTIQVDSPARVFIDTLGDFSFDFIAPEVDAAGFGNVFTVHGRVTPKQELVLRFALIDRQGVRLTETQMIRGEVIYPDGTLNDLPEIRYALFGADGVYEFRYDFAQAHPQVVSKGGRFIFLLTAGPLASAGNASGVVAQARVIMEIGPVPYLHSLSPESLECAPDGQAQLEVQLADVQSAQPGSIVAAITGEKGEINAQADEDGKMTANLEPLCKELIAEMDCSSQGYATLNLDIEAILKDGSESIQISREIPLKLFAQSCTPVPLQIGAGEGEDLAPPPPPDADQDGVIDFQDNCPAESGWALLGGCPPNQTALLITFAFGVIILGAVILFAYPAIRVRTFARPPEGYLVAYRRGKRIFEPVDIKQVGIRRKTDEVTIGSSQTRAHIYISGLKPVEFKVLEQNDRVIIIDERSGALRGTFRNLAPEEIATSNPDIVLLISLNKTMLGHEPPQH